METSVKCLLPSAPLGLSSEAVVGRPPESLNCQLREPWLGNNNLGREKLLPLEAMSI